MFRLSNKGRRDRGGKRFFKKENARAFSKKQSEKKKKKKKKKRALKNENSRNITNTN